MKTALYISIIMWILIIVGIQVCIPIIDRAQNHYTAHDRLKICQLREAMAND